MRWIVILFLLGALATVADANWYRYSDGYYYYGSGYQPYTRSYYQGYYSCGTYYPGYYSYTPYYAPTYTPPAAPVALDYKAEFLKIAKDQAEWKNILEGYNALGLKGTPLPPLPGTYGSSYGQSPYSTYGHSYYNTYPVLATTLYGYSQTPSFNQATNYQQTQTGANETELFQMFQQAVLGAQTMSSSATTQFGQSIDRKVQGNIEVARILSRAAGMDRLIRAAGQSLDSVPQATSGGVQFKIEPKANSTPDSGPERLLQPKVDDGGGSADPDQVVLRRWIGSGSKCVACHFKDNTGGTVKGRFHIGEYLKPPSPDNQYMSIFRAADRQAVLARVNPDAALDSRMPRTDDNKAGQPVTAQEWSDWQNLKGLSK